MFDDLLNYYGLDWIATILSVVAFWQLGNKDKKGFLVMMIANFIWVFVGVIAVSLAMVLANVFFLLINARALLKWRLSDDTKTEQQS